ncbi:MAG: hypothetical protein QF464_01025 [Myxococcota bacterium]|jgi:hypothetical protein|nr:hypothetical protein [Myxococcota bacterium]
MIGRVIALALGLGAIAVDALGSAPGGPGLVLGLAALVAAPGTTGTLASLLGLTALGVALGDGTTALLTPLGWVGHIALGLAMGAIARHADRSTVTLCHERPVLMGVGLVAAAAFVGMLPDDLLQLMTADGAPMQLSVALSEPDLATQMAVAVPARLRIAPPLHEVLQWLPGFAGLVAIALILGGLLGTRRATQTALFGVVAFALGLLVPALLDLAQLAGGGTVPLPPADALVVELGWLAGGVTGLSLHTPPAEGHLTLASRPVVSVLRLVVGVALVHWAWIHRGGGCPAPDSPRVSLAWSWVGVALSLVAWAAFMGFVSAERFDAIAPWGPQPVAWTVAGGALVAAAAGLGSLFGSRTASLATGLEVLSLGIWCCGVVAPVAGWLTS